MKFLKIFVLYFILELYAQSVIGQVRIGIHGGVNISSVTQTGSTQSGSGVTAYDYYSSDNYYYAGLKADYVLNSKFKLNLGLDYSKNGYSYFSRAEVSLGGAGSPTSRYKSAMINFIKLQTVISYGLPLGTGKMSIGAGGGLSLPISGQFTNDKICDFEVPSGPTRCVNVYTKSDLIYKDPVADITGILMYELKMGLFVELQYEYMFNVESVNFIPDPLFQGNDVKDKINLNVFKLGVGYYIPKMKRRNK